MQKQSLGLETMTGEQGVRLSGEERQRVGIARAALKQPGIMLLDESTSPLSTIDEIEIQRNPKTVSKRRSTIAIAHRLSTVMMTGEILLFEKCEIVEREKHKDLVAKNGFYPKICMLQAGGEQAM